MEYLSVGDRICLTFEDALGDTLTATVVRTLSDQEEGLSPEAEDYVACWIELHCDGEPGPALSNLVFMTDDRYLLDGRHVTIRKIVGME